MVAGFSCPFSLPGSPRLRIRPASQKSYHVRSVSLPCRSHPLISQLEDEILSVKSWQASQPEHESASASASWICDGLVRLELLHASLNDLINLPQNQVSIRRGSGPEWTDRILDDFLRFADAHGCFRSVLVAMNEHQSDAQIARRRNDAVKLASCSRFIKKTEKELVKLASSLRDVSKSPVTTRLTNSTTEESELAGVIREVINMTVSASMTVFLGVVTVSSTSTLSIVKSSWTPLRRLSPSSSFKSVGEEGKDCRRSAMENLEALQECLKTVESRSERLFRRLINLRVSLLNIMSAC